MQMAAVPGLRADAYSGCHHSHHAAFVAVRFTIQPGQLHGLLLLPFITVHSAAHMRICTRLQQLIRISSIILASASPIAARTCALIIASVLNALVVLTTIALW